MTPSAKPTPAGRTAHTAGPWKAEMHNDHLLDGLPAACRIWAGDTQICSMAGPDAIETTHPSTGFATKHQPGANALLIAQAPAMLALLKKIRHGKFTNGVINFSVECQNAVDAVLSAAEGRG